LGTAALVAALLFDRLMSDCFFEQGCGRNENLAMVGVLFAASLAGLISGWATSRTFRWALMRRRKKAS
jgi:hypothetical protein